MSELSGDIYCDPHDADGRLPAHIEAEKVARAMRALDLILEPEDAESAIENLSEAYERRRAHVGYALRWLWCQVGWIALNRGIDLLGRVRKAWAGK